MKYFIITIDTEGDNLWKHKLGDKISTKNSQYLPKFQELCNIYNFKPVYLVNYEMANDPFFVEFGCEIIKKKQAEIGIHLHAWNNPPNYEIYNHYNDYGLPYLIEYPFSVMLEKFDFLLNLLNKNFNCDIISHRSGRWAMNQNYFDILIQNGIKIDCSFTPHISWHKSKGYSKNSRGSDYKKCEEEPFIIKNSKLENTIMEIPVTIRKLNNLNIDNFNINTYFSSIKYLLKPKYIWLRPNGKNLQEMLSLVDFIKNSDSKYLMFMLHSSELMSSGSPTFKDDESINNLYYHLEILFNAISKNFKGITLKDFYNSIPITNQSRSK